MSTENVECSKIVNDQYYYIVLLCSWHPFCLHAGEECFCLHAGEECVAASSMHWYTQHNTFSSRFTYSEASRFSLWMKLQDSLWWSLKINHSEALRFTMKNHYESMNEALWFTVVKLQDSLWWSLKIHYSEASRFTMKNHYESMNEALRFTMVKH